MTDKNSKRVDEHTGKPCFGETCVLSSMDEDD